jgi:hypothetical protein
MITEPMSILTVDPGKATGVAWLEVAPGSPAEITQAFEIKGTLNEIEVMFYLWQEKRRFALTPIVLCEDWIPYQTEFATKPALAIEPMAWLKLLAHQAGIDIQTPAPQQRLAVSDEAIKRAGYWQKGGEGHKRSAVRHGLCWVLRQHHLPTMELLNPRPEAAQELTEPAQIDGEGSATGR